MPRGTPIRAAVVAFCTLAAYFHVTRYTSWAAPQRFTPQSEETPESLGAGAASVHAALTPPPGAPAQALTPPPGAPAEAAQYIVRWAGGECTRSSASSLDDCCLAEWRRNTESGDRQVRVVAARAGDVLFRMAVYESGDIVSQEIADKQLWESKMTIDVLGALRAVPVRTDTAGVALLDVGANIGWFTWAAAVNGHGVRAFEPFRQNINLMRATACLNPDVARRVQLHALGLGNETKTCYMVSETHINLGDGHTVCDPPHDVTKLPRGYQIIGKTPVRQLDQVWDDAAVSVMKMDTEGYELFVLKGSNEVFSSSRGPRVLFTEFSPRMIRERASEPAELLRFLKHHGYTCDRGALDGSEDAYVARLGSGVADLRCERSANVEKL